MTESKFEVALSTLSGHISQVSRFWFAGATINDFSKDPKNERGDSSHGRLLDLRVWRWSSR
jgi:hypothetical protein